MSIHTQSAAAPQQMRDMAHAFDRNGDVDVLIAAMAMLPEAYGDAEPANGVFWRLVRAANKGGHTRDALWRRRFAVAAAETHAALVARLRDQVPSDGVALDPNSQRVIVVTHQMLPRPHAPTLQVLNLRDRLASHDQLQLFAVNGELLPLQPEPALFDGFVANSLNLKGFQQLRFDEGVPLATFSPKTKPVGARKLAEIAAFVAGVRPRAVIAHGGWNLAGDVLAAHVPVACFPSSLAALATHAHATINYGARAGGHETLGPIQPATDHSIRYRTGADQLPAPDPDFQWSDVGLTEAQAGADRLPLIVPGARLAQEIGPRFEAGLAALLSAVPEAVLVFVGDASFAPQTVALERQRDQWVVAPKQSLERLRALLMAGEAMIDTPAPGNGTSGMLALAAGRPVFTISDLDNGLLFGVDGQAVDPDGLIALATAFCRDAAVRQTWVQKAAWWQAERAPIFLRGEQLEPDFQTVIDAAAAGFTARHDGVKFAAAE